MALAVAGAVQLPAAFGLAPAFAQAAPVSAEASGAVAQARFVGNWEGEVLFRNVLTGEVSTLAATMAGKPQSHAGQGDKVLLDLLLDDGKGKLVRQPFTVHIDGSRGSFTRDPGDEAVTLRIVSGNLTPAAGEPLSLVLEMRGSEQAVPMDVRETIEIAGDTMMWRREMKPDGGDWGFRSEYRFKRKP